MSDSAAPHPMAQIDALAALFALIVALAAPLKAGADAPLLLAAAGMTGGVIVAIGLYAALAGIAKPATGLADLAAAAGAALTGGLALSLLPTVAGKADVGYWALVAASALLALRLLRRLILRARSQPVGRLVFAPLAVVVGAFLVLGVWETADRGAAIVAVPAPSALAARAGIDLPDLWARLKKAISPATQAAG